MSGVQFSRYDLGRLKKGSVVVVTLTTGANVRLMDYSNLQAYNVSDQRRSRSAISGSRVGRSVVSLAGGS